MILFWFQLVLISVSIGILLKVWSSKGVQDWLKNRLRLIETASKLQGPRGLPLIGNALMFACKPEEILSRILEKFKPYEGLSRCWLGPKLIVIIRKPGDIRTILQSPNASYKDPIYRFAEKLFGRGILTSSGPTNRIHRKVIVSMLNAKMANSFVKYFDMHSQRCVEQLEHCIDTGEFDVWPYMEYCAVDSALNTIMGTPGITEQDGYKELASSISMMYNLAVDRMAKIWLHPNWIYACTKYQKLQDRSQSVIRRFVENLIVQKKKNYYEAPGTPRLMLLEQLVAYNEEMNLMDENRLRDEIRTVFITERVRTELFEVLGEDSVTERKLADLKYLTMVIKETVRLFPVAPLLFRKLTGDVHLESCTLPEGCSVAMIPFLTHRDPEYWSDPENFDPDRFSEENSVGRHSHAYIPFSGGSRGCIVSIPVSIGILLKVWLSKGVQDWLKNRLRLIETASKLQGPRSLPLIGNALIFACKPEEIFSRIIEKFKPYEGLSRCWLGPKLIVAIRKPEDIRTILQSPNASYKDPIYRFAAKLFGRGLLASSGPTNRIHRKVIVSMLNAKIVNSFVEYFDMYSQRCVERLEHRIDTGEFDVWPYMEYCAVDSALNTIMGTPGITQQDGHKDLVSSISMLYNLAADRMAKIWLHPDWIYACTKYQKLQDGSQSVIRRFLENLIVQKKKNYYEAPGTPRLMLLEQLVAHNEEMNLMDDDQLRDEIRTLFIAAEDSTTNMSSFVLLMLGVHPAIQERVRTELFEVLGEDSVTERKLADLKYLTMVIKETVRLFPIGPLLLRKLTGDVHLESCTLPEGCSVAMIPFLTHRDPEYWSDPENFNPDRFSEENSVGRHSHAYIPFSGGSRGCIGQRYGMLYVKTIVAHVVRKYRLNSNTSLSEIKLKSDIVLRSVNGYKISITRV